MQQIECATCTTKNVQGAAFCSACGAALGTGAPSGWALATAGIDEPAPTVAGTGPLRREELASWWARFGGSLLDSLILMVIVVVIVGGVAFVGALIDPEGISIAINSDSDGASSTGWVVLLVSLFFAVYIGWEVWWLRSANHMARPGQALAGFRVVRASDLTRLTAGRAFGRFGGKLLYGIPNIGTLLTLASAFTIGLGRERQGVHDMIAGTVCVRRTALAQRGIGPDAAGPSGAGVPVATTPFGAMSDSPLPPPPTSSSSNGPFS